LSRADRSTVDPELAAEQAHIDHAYACLAWMHARATELLAATDPKELDLVHALRRRVTSLTDGGRALCFGRIDLDTSESFHIGRRHVEDKKGEPVVIEWRAPAAMPFYRAAPTVPMGLQRRRQFLLDGRQILSMAEDTFGAGATAGRVRGGDALLAELERSRGGEMADIVATIQAEQDEVIRAPLAGVLVVQGGPGSGKTAVGLHRAAFLLYDEEALARQGVLVLGPNRVFLRYIAQVLPSLGEEAVVQTTVRDLAPGVRVVALDDPATEHIKGDARMATVLQRAVEQARKPLGEDIVVGVGLHRLTVTGDDATAAAATIAARRLPYEGGRGVLRDALVAALVERHPGATTDAHARIERDVRASAPMAAALDQLWPSLSPGALVRGLLTHRKLLAAAADGVLTAPEQAALRRAPVPTEPLEVRSSALPLPAWELRRQGARPPKVTRRDPWTAADVALLDEAAYLITGEVTTYGHVVVDEAQDLSPMQLRMVARRSPNGSVTVLGDLAQASSPWSPPAWDVVVEHLASPDGWRTAELRLGYRSPGDVISLASRLLPSAAPGVAPTEAVRAAAGGVVVEQVGNLTDAVREHAAVLASRHGSVAVVAPTEQLDDLSAALRASGADVARAEDGLGHAVTVVGPTAVKGLEFDAVVVADPAGIVASVPDRARGLRLLYVALTRPTQALAVLHLGDAPVELVP
jgi:DNA helicase IV